MSHNSMETPGEASFGVLDPYRINWSQIESMEDGGEATYFFISNRYALLLPWRAFPGPAETQAFLNQARDYWSAAKHGVPLPLDTGDTWPPPPHIGA